MIYKENYIVVGSTGRNTGKTEFVCRLIQQYSQEYRIVGVKVVAIERNEHESCPKGGKGCGVCSSLESEYEILEESIIDPSKDTSRMLIAGAQKVYFLKVDKDSLEEGFKALTRVIPDDAMVIIESNSIRKVFIPGLFIVIKNAEDRSIKESCAEVIGFADKVINFKDMSWDFDPRRILIKNREWILKEKATAIILAGGKSSRMGEEKSLLPIDGKPLIQFIIDQLEGHFDEILIGANEKQKYSFTQRKIVADIEQGKGPLMGVYSCLKESESDKNFITACDIPIMNIKFIKQMINISDSFDIVMPVSDGSEYEPLYAVYRKAVLTNAEKAISRNGRRVIELLDDSKVKLVDFSNQSWYRNINYKEDYFEFISKPNKNES